MEFVAFNNCKQYFNVVFTVNGWPADAVIMRQWKKNGKLSNLMKILNKCIYTDSANFNRSQASMLLFLPNKWILLYSISLIAKLTISHVTGGIIRMSWFKICWFPISQTGRVHDNYIVVRIHDYRNIVLRYLRVFTEPWNLFENSEFGMQSKMFLPYRIMNRLNSIRRSGAHKNVCWTTECTEVDHSVVF